MSSTDVLTEIADRVEAVDPRAASAALSRLNTHTSLAREDALPELIGRLAAIGSVCWDSPVVFICAGDHGVATTSSADAVRFIASGEAAVCSAARQAKAQLVIVDCGVRDPHNLGPGVLDFRIGDGTCDLRRGPAMTHADAIASVHTGIALVMSVANEGLDLLALGAVGAGQLVSASAVVDALAQPGQDPLAVLGRVGGYELGALAGAIIAAASIRIPIIVDDVATAAAALVAVRMCPRAGGYLLASHAGGDPIHRTALRALNLEPILGLGLASGEGTGAALMLPMIVAAAVVLAEMAPSPAG